MTPIERQYLLTVFITEPQAEHGKIKDVIHDLSGGNLKIAKFHALCISIVFSTKLTAWQIEDRLIGSVLNGDKRLLVELGRDWSTYGLEDAEIWLTRNLGHRK